ncbi:MAG: hypothetical protein A2600_06030 [Candidatus Lambdaproteobacteria bacterium RIFOXYD1_FULL_56_27]|uniref:histidine kinase n=1 Tax=Candidatus Lambdaproteobacteria bacterium RIFOXYD2_FULL_56_26 TaxID=1817773 RepID=A0A1F6GMC8_9PROT|nr:MAG: hypothetical protein A2557_10155 [Candidatus Lambdaproteobacteria bacterium RIFOXYD2_FULL_56_26]OGH01766.1 MAG: hypothetical protein A2426_14065 [Candidatus Lambdaproteobacteria bacterium RIFOXYC1_FULL_56_13]OGH07639.1 MAG: hypothetical protein A2600_06030 [Candidatus Lambdaproteobacteria bacterium RIFOXYD1_FULL_56_27]
MDLSTAVVLIVDDTLKNIQVLGSVLRSEGLQVSVAQNGAQAIQIARKLKPDLILLDVMMPEMDGFTACKELKGYPETAEIPVIFLTAKVEANDVVAGLKIGAVDYIAKPFNVPELLVRVRNHLELALAKRKIAAQAEDQRQLLHILCHDLANSIGSVLSFLSFSEEEFREGLGTYKTAMETSAQNGMDLIELVRKMRALDDGKLGLEMVPFRLDQLVQKSLELLERKFFQKGIKLTTQVDPDLWVKVDGISFVNSVLNNLLTNACKFSEPGGEVRITGRRVGSEAMLCVEDQGIGIPERLLEQLFDSQKATSRPGTQGEPGTGFGLPLVKKFVGQFGGRLEILSKTDPPGRGTKACLYLPWVAVPA